jgi:hypothetical protein
MAYRLPGGRVSLDLDGPPVEVERVASPLIHQLGLNRLAAVISAKTTGARASALLELYELVIGEAQPTWEVLDHRGVVLPTASGMSRLPMELGLAIATGWLETLVVEEQQPASAVDAVIPPGKARNEIKRRLRAVKAA